MPTKKTMLKVRCPGCENSVFKATMRPFLGLLYCVECFVRRTLKKDDELSLQQDRQRQRMKLKEKDMPVKYGTAEHVQVTDDGKAVISEDKLSKEEAEEATSKTASKRSTSKRAKNVTVTDQDFKRTDEDHIPGD